MSKPEPPAYHETTSGPRSGPPRSFSDFPTIVVLREYIATTATATLIMTDFSITSPSITTIRA